MSNPNRSQSLVARRNSLQMTSYRLSNHFDLRHIKQPRFENRIIEQIRAFVCALLPIVRRGSDSRVSDGELSHDISKVWLTLNCNEEMR